MSRANREKSAAKARALRGKTPGGNRAERRAEAAVKKAAESVAAKLGGVSAKGLGEEKKTRSARPVPRCAHPDNCVACPLVCDDYPTQLKRKFEKVYRAFKEAGFPEGELRTLVRSTRPSPQTIGYRNKAKWILETQPGGEIKMGIYRPGSHEVVDISQCLVHAPAINDLSNFIRAGLQANAVPCGAPKDGRPTVRYMIVRYSFREKKLLVVFVTSHETVPGLDAVVRMVDENSAWSERVVAIVQNINNDPGNVLLGEANRFLRKKRELTENMGPYRVPVGPLSFLQVNSLQAAYLYKRVKELLGKGPFDAGLDLYSGVGLIAMHMAPVTKRVLAVEEVGPAALEGITAARRNRINNILELCADALEGVQTFANEWGAPDWVVLNPPRKGCDEAVLQAVAQRGPKRVVYVSCNPNTLARDIKILLDLQPALALRAIEPVDMFPQTEHVECLVLLENRNFKRSIKGALEKKRMPRGRLNAKSIH